MARYLSFLICCLALLPQLLFSQQSAAVVTSVSQERIYLQTDKPYYTAGDTVWFRAHLVDAETYEPVSRSRFVYIELHDQDADGNASVTFFASDTSRRYLVTIEGVSDDDTIVHQQQVIE